MRSFRSPNSGQTSLSLQHSTSPSSGYKPPAGHNADGYTNGGDRVGFAKGGRAKDRHPPKKQRGSSVVDVFKSYGKYKGEPIELKSGGRAKKNWIQDVNKSIKKRGTKGKCTPITKKGCTGRAKALAKTFKKMAKKRKS